jgi:hypothetical protein
MPTTIATTHYIMQNYGHKTKDNQNCLQTATNTHQHFEPKKLKKKTLDAPYNRLQLARPYTTFKFQILEWWRGISHTWMAKVGESRFEIGLDWKTFAMCTMNLGCKFKNLYNVHYESRMLIEKPLQCALWIWDANKKLPTISDKSWPIINDKSQCQQMYMDSNLFLSSILQVPICPQLCFSNSNSQLQM